MGDRIVTIGKLKLRLDLQQLLDGYESRESRRRRKMIRAKGMEDFYPEDFYPREKHFKSRIKITINAIMATFFRD